MPTKPVYLKWKDKAVEDLLTILAYIADDSVEAAQALKDAINEKVSSLPEFPHMYKIGRVKKTREMVVHPNYIVVYTEADDIIYVLRALHSAQQFP